MRLSCAVDQLARHVWRYDNQSSFFFLIIKLEKLVTKNKEKNFEIFSLDFIEIFKTKKGNTLRKILIFHTLNKFFPYTKY